MQHLQRSCPGSELGAGEPRVDCRRHNVKADPGTAGTWATCSTTAVACVQCDSLQKLLEIPINACVILIVDTPCNRGEKEHEELSLLLLLPIVRFAIQTAASPNAQLVFHNII